MLINDASITGSLIVNASASFQNINVAGNIIPDTTNIHNLGSADKYFKEIFVSTGSINFVDNTGIIGTLNAGTITAIQSNTSSANSRLDAIESFTSSLNNTYTTDAELNASSSTLTSNINTKLNSSSFNSFTASVAETNTFTSSTTARLNALETTSASVNTSDTNQNNRLGSLENISASNLIRLSALETTSASVDTLNTAQNARLSALETTSASVDTLNTNQNTKLTNLENKTGSLATTGSNTFFGTQIFSGSVYVKENLIVQGSSSLQNITASAVDIGTNKIILNANTPSVRYAGISVYDSGSNLGTGSLFWDSVDNHWLYEHPADSGAPYNSAILISGPKNEGNLGEELDLVTNYIVKAVGGDHISSSAIYDDGNTIALKSNTEISGTLKVGAYTASFSAPVGIGTITPTQKLHIDGAIRLTSNPSVTGDASSAHFWNQAGVGPTIAGANFQVQTNGTTSALYIDSSQKVGIGTIAPSKLLDVRGDSVIYSSNGSYTEGLSVVYTGTATEGGGINLHSGSVGATLNGTSLKAYLRLRSNNDFVIGRYGSPSGDYYPFQIVYANGNILLAKNEGNVGIATTSPTYKLDIVGASNSGIRLKQGGQIQNTVASTNFYNALTFENTDTTHAWSIGYSQGGSFSINYFDASSTYSRIATFTTSGVGIGTTSPGSQLHMYNAGSTVRFRMEAGSTGASLIDFYNDSTPRWSIGIDNTQSYGKLENRVLGTDAIRFYDSSNNVVAVPSSGNMGIGITNPTSKLHVAGHISGSGNIVLSDTNLIVNAGKVGFRNQGLSEYITGEAWTTALYNYNNNDGFLIYNRDSSDVAHPVFHVGGWNNAGYGGWSNADSLVTLVRADGTKSEGSTYAGRGLSNSSYYSNIVKTTTKTIFRDIQGRHEFDGSVIHKRSGEVVVYNEGNYATTTGWNNGDTTTITIQPFGSCVVHGWNNANKNFTLTLSSLPSHSYIKVEACFHMVDSVDDEWNYFYVSNDAGSDVQLGQWKKVYNAPPNGVTFSNGAFGVWNKGIYYSYRPWGNGTYGNDGFYELNSNWQPHSASSFLTKFVTEVDQPATDEAVYISHVKVTVR